MRGSHRCYCALLLLINTAGCSSSGMSAATTDDSNAGGGTANAGGSAEAGGGTVNAGGGAATEPSTAGSKGSLPTATGGAGGSADGGEPNGGKPNGEPTGGDGNASSGGSAASGNANGGQTNGGGGKTSSGGSAAGGDASNPSSLPSITVHLAGDSTMASYAATTTQEGWGQELGQYFSGQVRIDNQGLPGANVQSFYSSSHWKTIISNIKAGDFVMAAFGTNDSGTTHGPVSTADFSAEYTQMASEIEAKDATFIITTPSPLQIWVNGKDTNTRLQPYCDTLIALGKAKNLMVDDLNARGVEYYDMLGQTAAAALEFNGDKAHFNKQGATAMAGLAAKELARIGSPLAGYLK